MTAYVLENKGMRGVLQEKANKSPVKGHNYEFLSLFFETLGHLEYFNPLNGMRFWKIRYFISQKGHCGTCGTHTQ